MTQGIAQPPTPVEKASPGIHDAAFEALRRFAPPPGRVVDLGAGTGAWTGRLRSAGYTVTPVDREPGQWALEPSALVERDLHREFADELGGPFDAVTSLEVIEHLENPWHFLRGCRRLVGDNGIVVLTTPNIENTAGRLRFLLTGQLRGFDRDPAWNEPTHISPIQTYLFEKMCKEARLVLLWHGYNRPTESTRGLGKRVVLAGLRRVLAGAAGGDNHVFVLRPHQA